MKVEVIPSTIPGCYQLQPAVFRDERGSFVKTFHRDVFAHYNLETNFAEEYYSLSQRNILRGLHFQVPPKEHVKIVYCVLGEVIDVVVDLRLGSPTYGKFEVFEVSPEKANLIYIPAGLAHGFYVISEKTIMMYKVSTVYSPAEDSGILWNSIGIPWPSNNPIISQRDSSFSPFSQFTSPFKY